MSPDACTRSAGPRGCTSGSSSRWSSGQALEVRPAALAGHRAIAEAIRSGDAPAAAAAMTAHIALVSDVPLLVDDG